MVQENQAICDTYAKAIQTYNPSYDGIGLDDYSSKKQMGHHLMAAIQDQPTLAIIEQERQKAVETARQCSAWRLDGTLREFPRFKTVNAWFKFPVHVLDDSLQDITLEDNPKEKWKKGTKKSNENKADKSKREFEEAFNILSEDGKPVNVNQIADYLDIARNTVYSRIKKHEKFECDNGEVLKIEKE